MSLLGKILAGLNILAAIIFVCLAAADWGQRQAWTYAVFRQDLFLNGLPVDEDEQEPDGVRQVDRISEQTLQDLFRPVGGGVPTSNPSPEDKTQMGEVRRVETRLQGEIDSLPDNDKRTRYLGILTPLARTAGDRWRLQTTNLGDLQTEFNRAFHADLLKTRALEGLQPGDKDREEKRRAIAHLLVNLPGKPDDYQRVLVVIGLKAFAQEADQQATALREMTQELLLAMTRDEGTFVAEHRRIVDELRELADKLAQKQATLKEKTQLTQRHQSLVEDRKKDVADLQKRIEEARQMNQETLAQLSARQRRLFQAQQEVKTTAEQNQELERKLWQMEKVKP